MSSTSSASTAVASAASATMALRFKEYIANMPDTFDTKKEIDAYLKDAMKNINGNDDKPKKELNAYQQYVKDNCEPVKKQNPSLSGKEVLSLIATMWQKTQNADGTKSAKSKVSKSKKEKPDEVEKAIPVEEEDKEEKVIDEIKEEKEELTIVPDVVVKPKKKK
uniref:HMG box domain-containing protein n=1 Tax=viral metagenome TaxID=1070528 RepID=A0A6C0LK47_9ZZZZ